MKYEAPALTVLTPAISVIQQVSTKALPASGDSPDINEASLGYQDWES